MNNNYMYQDIFSQYIGKTIKTIKELESNNQAKFAIEILFTDNTTLYIQSVDHYDGLVASKKNPIEL